MAVTILAIGKKHEDWVDQGIERYQKRLKAPFNVTWILLPHSTLEGPAARQEESGRIAERLPERSYVVLLDERGTELDSISLSERFESQFSHSSSITVIIGGAYGVTDELRTRADFIWSLSPLVFPHQLVRLILIEQLYRMQTIALGGAYHHE
jgi:23S rRNA (pseudouridine1915-N3)-methyltransferase